MTPIVCVFRKKQCSMEYFSKQLVNLCWLASKIMLPAFLVCWGMAGLLAFSSVSADAQEKPSRTWKTLAELSAEERASLDQSPETPRHPQFPYLPVEPYPFFLRTVRKKWACEPWNLTHWKRWSSAYAQVYGSIDAYGFMPVWGKNATFIFYREPEGVVMFTLDPVRTIIAPCCNTPRRRKPLAIRRSMSVIVRISRYPKSRMSFVTRPRCAACVAIRRLLDRVSMPGTPSPMTMMWAEMPGSLPGASLEPMYSTRPSVFPVTRPTITLAKADGTFIDVSTKTLKLMGEEYPLYTVGGECSVM